ncbi:MAG: nucleoside kinase [Clostridia bacterium]|nr:nucleoside kinase [Clostridia bacterium]
MEGIMACKISNEVKSLDDAVLKRDCVFDIVDYTSADGSRIYVRGLTFIMLKAFEEVFPNVRITVNYSLGHSLYCEAEDESEITLEMLKQIEEKMKDIIEKNLRFEKKVLSVEEAKAMYKQHGRDDKVGIIGNRMKSHVSVYVCGETMNYFYGAMPLSTGAVKYFDILKYENGFLLVYPRRSNPTKVQKIIETKKLYNTFNDYDKLHKILNVSTVSELNNWIKSGKIADLIRISEALHEKKIANIADMIAGDRNKKIVLIAGPSSSGKTTFAQRLGIQLRVNGIEAVTLSMDNYFVNREYTPRDENGNYDFECLEAIDIKLFNDQLTALLNGEEVDLPTFDFTDGTRHYLGNKAQLKENQVLVVEGIHGLNEKLTESIPRANKFKIYISALTALNIDDYNRISTTDSRILRRMLRDSKYRSHSATATLKMWPSVRNGEEKYIFPYQEDADVMFNSSLIYEIAILKTYVEPLLASVDRTEPEFSEAKRLYEFLGYFLPIEKDDIPINSIIREFIGGGCFYR